MLTFKKTAQGGSNQFQQFWGNVLLEGLALQKFYIVRKTDLKQYQSHVKIFQLWRTD